MKTFPDRPKNLLNVEEADRLDYEESQLPENSWECTLDEDEFEVEKILDVRSGRRTRVGRVQRQYLVQWKGSVNPTWIDEVGLNCEALLQEFDRDRVSSNRFEVMQSHEAAVDELPMCRIESCLQEVGRCDSKRRAVCGNPGYQTRSQ